MPSCAASTKIPAPSNSSASWLPYRSVGLGRLMLKELMRIAFRELGAHRLFLDVYEDNSRARHLSRESWIPVRRSHARSRSARRQLVQSLPDVDLGVRIQIIAPLIASPNPWSSLLIPVFHHTLLRLRPIYTSQ